MSVPQLVLLGGTLMHQRRRKEKHLKTLSYEGIVFENDECITKNDARVIRALVKTPAHHAACHAPRRHAPRHACLYFEPVLCIIAQVLMRVPTASRAAVCGSALCVWCVGYKSGLLLWLWPNNPSGFSGRLLISAIDHRSAVDLFIAIKILLLV